MTSECCLVWSATRDPESGLCAVPVWFRSYGTSCRQTLLEFSIKFKRVHIAEPQTWAYLIVPEYHLRPFNGMPTKVESNSAGERIFRLVLL